MSDAGLTRSRKLLGEQFGVPVERQPESFAAFNDPPARSARRRVRAAA